MSELTHTRLLEVLSYDANTGVFTWRKNVGAAKPGKPAGCVMGNKYVAIRVDTKLYLAHRLAWFYVHQAWPVGILDHKDRDRANNALSNLRVATPLLNSRNRTGATGVSWCNTYNKWIASIGLNNKRKALGAFDNYDDAVSARKAAEETLRWDSI